MANWLNPAMTALLQTPEFIGKRIVIAYSGGLDSSVLLHELAATNADSIRAVHVHHGLHPDADAWAQHCERECRALKISLTVCRVQINQAQGSGLEAAARDARYRAMKAQMHTNEILVTAHHQNDQAETILQRLMRASGSQGLASMRAYTHANGMPQYRPLLGVSRNALLAHAQARGFSWIEDPSNASAHFDRNFIRGQVIPLLETRWPHAVSMLSRSADILQQEHQCLQEQAALYLSQIQTLDPKVIDVCKLRDLSLAWRAQVLRYWLAELKQPALPASVLQQIERELLSSKAEDSEACVRWEGTCLYRWRDVLVCTPEMLPISANWQQNWHGIEPVVMPDEQRWGWLSNAPINISSADIHHYFDGPLRLSIRQGGEKIQLPKRQHRSSIKQCLQAIGIPPWQRQRLPLLSNQQGECLAFGDVLISEKLLQFQQMHGLRFALMDS
jgi:tRNA(Ile)-lysidine synthase